MSDIKTKLDPDMLDEVAGGIIFDSSGISGADSVNHWEVLNDKTGEKMASYDNRDDAIANAGRLGQNHMEVNWDQVLQLRGQK